MIEVRDIPDFNDYLESLLVKNESDDLEFKSAAGGFPGNFWDTYSAFANSEGGTIVLGVQEKKGKFFLDNLTKEQVEKYRKDFWNNVNNRSTISINLMREEDLVLGNYKGHAFMLFFVPRASREQRPVFRTTDPYKGTFKRNFEGDYKCTEKEIRRMFADADENSPADSRILKGYSLEDIDQEALKRYRQLFSLSNPDHPWLALEDIELLRKLGGYRKDRQSQEEGFTVAGLLMFGKTDSITDPECSPYFSPDYQEHLTEDEDVRWTYRLHADGTWEANLFNFYQRVLPRLQAALPKPFKLEGNIRREDTPAHVAVREALTNLCIHPDFSVNASLLVKLDLHRFVFSNPGTMLVSRDQYYTGGESVCRNQSLQKMFSMLGVAEKAGSGTDKIMKGWREANWRSPNIEELQTPDKVVLTMPMESFLSEDTKSKLTAKFGIIANSFDHNVLMTLALVSDEGYVTNTRLRYSLNLHKSEISNMLKLMTQKGLLVSEGYGRGTRYALPINGIDVLREEASEIAGSTQNMATSSPNMATSSPNMATSVKKKMSREELQKLILQNCLEWVSLEELATMVCKAPKYLRNTILPLMLASNQIEMMYPTIPHHPKQKYKIKD